MRPLAPRSAKLYRALMMRAFGRASAPVGAPLEDLTTWTEPMKDLLRAAVTRAYSEAGRATEARAIRESIPRAYRIKRLTRIPGEEDARAFERATAGSLPRGRKALVLLPLALGLRAEEVCALRRDEVERAVATGELVFVRKGGKEHMLRVVKVKGLLTELLETPAAPGRVDISKPPEKPKAWKRAGEILSPGKYKTQYNILRGLVKDMAKAAGIETISPHKLRHAFATRMNRDGASIFTIQSALNHANVAVTQRYVHPSAADAERFFREF